MHDAPHIIIFNRDNEQIDMNERMEIITICVYLMLDHAAVDEETKQKKKKQIKINGFAIHLWRGFDNYG